MHICHLNIAAENIMIRNGEFIVGSDGTIDINPKLCVKVCDFSLAEVFRCSSFGGHSSKQDFDCSKNSDISVYSNPNVLSLKTYSARKADIWAMGILLYSLSFNEYPSDSLTEEVNGFCVVKTDDLATYIKENMLSKYATDASFKLICGMLNCYEKQRYNALTVLQSRWLNSYWQKYKVRIAKKTFSQRQQLDTEWQRKMRVHFPYYQN